MSEDNSLGDPVKLARRLIETGEAWANAAHAASLLEETKTTLLAKLMKEHAFQNYKTDFGTVAKMQIPMNQAEMLAKSDPRYEAHIKAMVDAQREATKARVRYDSGRAFIDLARSAESTRRAEMGMR